MILSKMAKIELSDKGFDSNKSMSMFLKLVSIHTGLLVVALSAADVRRLVTCDEIGETIEVNKNTEDPLAKLLVDSMIDLTQTERVGSNEVDVSPAASVAVIFDRRKEAKDLKGRMWLACDLHDRAKVVACLTSCKFELQDVFLTSRFTPQYIRVNDLPSDLHSYWFVDVVSSIRKPAGPVFF